MNGAARTGTRDIARAAVRAELARVAFDLFRQQGFDNVTLSDLAAAAGVSRSTFLRYFGSKEEAVLSAFDAQGDQVADTLRARPGDEDDWTALRRALDTVLEQYRLDPVGALAMWRLEKQHGWRPALAQALAQRSNPAQLTTLGHAVRAAAALDCLNVALDHWSASGGQLDLVDLLDEAFAALAPRRAGTTDSRVHALPDESDRGR
jgi:AcrR family transcriptional regulator